MINAEKYTLTLDRLEVCDLLLACTNIVWQSIHEMKEEPDCPQYRRKHVLPGTIAKWQKLHDLIEKQLDQEDEARGI